MPSKNVGCVMSYLISAQSIVEKTHTSIVIPFEGRDGKCGKPILNKMFLIIWRNCSFLSLQSSIWNEKYSPILSYNNRIKLIKFIWFLQQTFQVLGGKGRSPYYFNRRHKLYPPMRGNVGCLLSKVIRKGPPLRNSLSSVAWRARHFRWIS